MRILAIDGGGIRGVYPAYMLSRISGEFGIEFHQCFDLIAGTSTGAIIAAALSTSYPIEKVLNLYEKDGSKIFSKKFLGLFGFIRSRYHNRYLKNLLDQIFRDKKMPDALTRLMIPATDIGNGQVFVTKSSYLTEFIRDKDIKIADAVIASCSAPKYFDPVVVKEYLLADGGLWANNPSLAAYVEATGKLGHDPGSVRLLSIGTGIGNKYYPRSSLNRWWRRSRFLGLNFYGLKLIDLFLNLQSKSTQNMMELLMDERHYLRLNFETDRKLSLDNIKIIEDIKSRADKDFTYNYKRINSFLTNCM